MKLDTALAKDTWILNQTNERAISCILLGQPSHESDWGFLANYRQVLWFTAQNTADLADISDKVIPIPCQDIDDSMLLQAIDSFITKDPMQMPDFKIASSVLGQHTAEYDRIIETTQYRLDETVRIRNTRQDEAAIWQQHIITNMADYAQNRMGKEWLGLGKGRTAAIVASGPSIDNSLEKLAKNRDAFTIFACDSALNTLDNHRIEPDFTISIDAAKFPNDCCPPAINPGTLILDAISPPEWKDYDPQRGHYYITGNHLSLDWLESGYGASKGPIQVRCNCGITAMLLANSMQFDSLYLFGMDLASSVEDPSKRYSNASNPNISRGKQFKVDGVQKQIPGNFHEKVPTFLYHEWFQINEIVSGISNERKVFNINDRGAKIERASLVHPNDFKRPQSAAKSKLQLPDPLKIPAESHQQLELKIAENLAILEQFLAKAKQLIADKNYRELHQYLIHLFQDDNFARFLGTLSMKHLPSLANPDRITANFYSEVIRDLKTLVSANR